MWFGSIQTALCTIAFIAARLSARSCNVDHSHALLFYCPNTLQSMSMTTFFYLRLFVRAFVCFFVYSCVRLLVECMAATAGCGVVLNDQVWVRLHLLLACCLHECLELQYRSP